MGAEKDFLKSFDRLSRRILSRTKTSTAEPQLLWSAFLYAGAVVGLQFISPNTRVLSILALCLLAFFGRSGPAKALSVLPLILFANPGLAQASPELSSLKWVLIAACGIKLAFTYKLQVDSLRSIRRGVIAYTIAISLLVLVTSSDKLLSSLKLVSWSVATLVTLAALSEQSIDTKDLMDWLFSVYAAVLALSIPLLYLPEGRLLNGTGFQGIFSHPQTFGLFIAPFTAMLTLEILQSTFITWPNMIVAGLGWVMLIATECRTGVLAIFLGFAVYVCSGLFSRRNARGTPSMHKPALRAILGCVIALGIATLWSDKVMVGINSFMMKGRNISLSGQMYKKGGIGSSREDQVESQIAQIKTTPFAGNGFGLAPEGLLQASEISSTFGIPVSSPTEPGNLILAILSQTGLFGALAFVFMMTPACRQIILGRSPEGSILFWTVLLTTLGEMTFFAAGGYGLQLWMLIALSARLSSEVRKPFRSPLQIRLARASTEGWPLSLGPARRTR